jgi:hypothetical protein
MKAISCLAVVALAACSDATAPRQIAAPSRAVAAVLTNTRTPISGLVQSCGGELVQIDGILHFKILATFPASGGVMARLSLDQTFSGIGLESGLKYVGSSKSSEQDIFVSGSRITMELTERLIGQGQIPNTFLDEKLTFAVNPNGDVTQDSNTTTSRCS